jgi:hypothetical protein
LNPHASDRFTDPQAKLKDFTSNAMVVQQPYPFVLIVRRIIRLTRGKLYQKAGAHRGVFIAKSSGTVSSSAGAVVDG